MSQKLFLWYLSQAIDLDSQGCYYFERALIYQFQNKWKQAISDLKKATRLEPKNQLYHQELIRCHLQQRQYPQAITISNVLLNINPRHTMAWEYKAQALEAIKDFKEAQLARAYADILDPNKEKRIPPPELKGFLQNIPPTIQGFIKIFEGK